MRKKSLIIALFIIAIDQIVKIVVDSILHFSELRSIIPHFFYLTKVYNDGAAWSMFDGAVVFLIIIAILALIFLYKYQKCFKENYRNMLAFALIYGGLIGNLIDRIVYGHVIDYFKLLIGNYNFPIFNLADMAIVSGFILLIIAIIKGEENGSSSKGRKSKIR